MDVFVEGIRIELNQSQIEIVEKARRRRERCTNSFIKILSHFGFKGIKDDCYPSNVKAFENSKEGWYAELTVHNEHWQSVWMVGGELKQGSFPGGWVYESPKDIEIEILRVLAIN